MLMQHAIFASTLAAAFAEAPTSYARGFVRQPHPGREAMPVATITAEMRAAAPAALDWTTKGAVTPVKNQGSCGSCWAFSATEGVESGVFMSSGALPVLSAQQIIACDKDEVDGGGCDGGDLPGAFAYVISAGGMDTEANYPCTSAGGSTGQCKWSGHKEVVVTDWKYAVKPCAESEQAQGGACADQDEDGLKAALDSFGPLSVCVNAQSWDFYSGGVLSDSCSGAWDQLDHCVQLVGYDATASSPYWKVKNSWGSGWGEGGYIRLPMGKNSCGIADEATYVIATTAGPSPPPTPPVPTPPTPTPPPSPPPTPPPSPPPTPSPATYHDCDDSQIEDQNTCENYLDTASGTACEWCYLSGLGFGYCVSPEEGTQGCNFDRAAAINSFRSVVV